MGTKKVTGKKTVKAVTVLEAPRLEHRLQTLLHTVRCIAQHEDELCTLFHAAQFEGAVGDDLAAELHALLDRMPAQEYVHDLEAVREAVPARVVRNSTRMQAGKKSAAGLKVKEAS